MINLCRIYLPIICKKQKTNTKNLNKADLRYLSKRIRNVLSVIKTA